MFLPLCRVGWPYWFAPKVNNEKTFTPGRGKGLTLISPHNLEQIPAARMFHIVLTDSSTIECWRVTPLYRSFLGLKP